MITTALVSLNDCSNEPLLQVQATFFLVTKGLPSLSWRSSPSSIWQIMSFGIGIVPVFDPGCMMTSRIETVLKPGMTDGFCAAYARCTTPGYGDVSV